MDAFILEAAATASGIVVATAIWFRKPAVRRAALPRISKTARSARGVRRRHRRVVRAIAELAQECIERHPDGSFQAFTAREAVKTYLPETLAAYLAVPCALRRVRRAGGVSADDELSRQLGMLRTGLEGIRQSDAEVGATQMAANRAFLRERFPAADISRPPERQSILSEFVDVIEGAFHRP